MARTPLTDLTAGRIALIKPSALGDVVHALPVLDALRQRFPDAHLTWVVNRAYAPLLEGHPDLDAVLAFDRGALKRGWWAAARTSAGFFGELRRQRFDLVIDLQGLLRSGLMAWATRAPRRVGLATAREGATWFYTDKLPTPPLAAVHAVDRYWKVAEALGVGDLRKRFTLPDRPEAAAWARKQLARHPRPYLMLNLGTRWETKRWPTAHFAALARRAVAAFGGTVVLVGGPDEAHLTPPVEEALGGAALSLVGRTTLPQLVAVLREADAVVSNDSGPLHLADALARPVVAPYTCTSPIRTGPYRRPHGACLTDVTCAASYLKTCGRMVCMPDLTPDRLWPALQGILSTCQRRSA